MEESLYKKGKKKAFSIGNSLKSKDVYEFCDNCLIGKQTIA